MTDTLVDSSVLLDVMTGDATWGVWSAKSLALAADEGRLVINPIIYAEVSVRFTRIEDLDDALPEGDFLRAEIPWAAGFLAAKAFVASRRRGGTRTAPLPDFFIGAHAAISELRLLTRDPTRVAQAFPSVRLVAP